jgi:hypothetical protein
MGSALVVDPDNGTEEGAPGSFHTILKILSILSKNFLSSCSLLHPVLRNIIHQIILIYGKVIRTLKDEWRIRK